MSKIKNFKKGKGYESIPREILQHPRLSLQAIGLLCNLQSYPEDWVLYKTELYKRFPKNKKTSIANAWKELEAESHVVSVKKRNGNKNEYVHYFSIEPFTDDDVKEIEKAEQGEILSFRFSAPQNENLKMRTSKPAANKLHKKDNTQEEKIHKENKQTIYLSKIEELNELEIPTKMKQVIKQNMDRLIDDSVSLLDIEIFYTSATNDLHINDFCIVLNNVLSKTKGEIKSISNLLTTAIESYYIYVIHPRAAASDAGEDRSAGEIPNDHWLNS